MSYRETLYRKKGRRYVPVAEYDQIAMDAMPAGAHLVVVEPGIRSTRYNVQPFNASVLAAIRTAETAMVEAMREAGLPRPAGEWTKEQHSAWDAVKHLLDGKRLEVSSISAIVGAGCLALEKAMGVEKP